MMGIYNWAIAGSLFLFIYCLISNLAECVQSNDPVQSIPYKGVLPVLCLNRLHCWCVDKKLYPLKFQDYEINCTEPITWLSLLVLDST